MSDLRKNDKPNAFFDNVAKTIEDAQGKDVEAV